MKDFSKISNAIAAALGGVADSVETEDDRVAADGLLEEVAGYLGTFANRIESQTSVVHCLSSDLPALEAAKAGENRRRDKDHAPAASHHPGTASRATGKVMTMARFKALDARARMEFLQRGGKLTD